MQLKILFFFCFGSEHQGSKMGSACTSPNYRLVHIEPNPLAHRLQEKTVLQDAALRQRFAVALSDAKQIQLQQHEIILKRIEKRLAELTTNAKPKSKSKSSINNASNDINQLREPEPDTTVAGWQTEIKLRSSAFQELLRWTLGQRHTRACSKRWAVILPVCNMMTLAPCFLIWHDSIWSSLTLSYSR